MTRIKYPRTFHFHWSEGVQSDDKIISTLQHLEGKRIIVTEKMDGENTTLHRDYMHARSVDSAHHPSRDWIKTFWGNLAHEIPEGMRVCGENLFAKHSIAYDALPSYFMGFSMWNGETCLDWDTTMEYFELLSIVPVPVLYDGIYDEQKIQALWDPSRGTEGYVVRVAEAFVYEDFATHVAKFVRANHVQTNKHWRNQEIVPNNLKPVL
jgi:hypothetical protein